MKPKKECVISVNAALGALLEDTGAKSQQEVTNVMILTVSTCVIGLVRTVGPQVTRELLEAAIAQVKDSERQAAAQLLAPGTVQ
jgi:hypothetical protein